MGKQFRLIGWSGVLASFVVLTGCQTSTMLGPESYLAHHHDYMPEVKRFPVCHDMDCDNSTPVTLDKSTWIKLGKYFSVVPVSAAAERRQISLAIAMFEKVTGPIAETQFDQARNSLSGWSDRQLDCIAETVNTTTYLLLLQQQGWLKWHTVGYPKHRGFITLHAPHNAAVITEKATGNEYVVDSWFHKNGEQPEIVTVKQWSNGYDPDN